MSRHSAQFQRVLAQWRADNPWRVVGDEAYMSPRMIAARRMHMNTVGLCENDTILNPDQLAEWLGIPVSTIREMTRTRAQQRDKYPIPFFRIGKRVRFNKTEVLAWLTKLEQAK